MKKVISILLSVISFCYISSGICAFADNISNNILVGDQAISIYQNFSGDIYYKDTKTEIWYHVNSQIQEKFDTENYYSGIDTQIVMYNNKKYTVDCKNQIAYVDGVQDEFATEIVKFVYKEADQVVAVRDYSDQYVTYLGKVPFYKVVFKDNFKSEIYAFNELIAISYMTLDEKGQYKEMTIDSEMNYFYKEVDYGDVNIDENVDMKDVVALQQKIADLDSDVFSITADVNEDTYANLKDVVLIQRYIADI